MKHSCEHHFDNAKGTCIHKVPIFNDLNPEEIFELSTIIKKSSFKKGEIIFNVGDTNRNLIFINKGKVKLYRISEDGREQLLRVLGIGDFTGELSLFNDSIVPNNAEAAEDTEVCIIEKDKLTELILRIPNIAVKILKELSQRLINAETIIEHLGIYDVEQRVVSFLLELGKNKKHNDLGHIDIMLPMSKKDFASYIGTTQETLSRKLSMLQKQGIIKLKGRREIILIDEKKLQDIST